MWKGKPEPLNQPVCWAEMRYFFDTRDNETFFRDEDGLEFADFDEVKLEASRALAELAMEVLPGSVRRVMAIEVCAGTGRTVILVTTIVFEVVVLL